MLSKVKDRLPIIGYDGFKRVMIHLMREVRFENIILSGAEVTTFAELEKYVSFAASLGCFNKIQIQTNGRRLCDRGYLEGLVHSGVNEFFVSIHGFEKTHDAATGVHGSFRQTIQGLQNLSGCKGVNVISNTVLTNKNWQELPDFVRFMGNQCVSEIHVWNYFPMESAAEISAQGARNRDLILPLEKLRRILPELEDICRQAGKALVLKSFPMCLLANPPVYLDSIFPEPVLPDLFWKEFKKCGFGQCVHLEEKNCESRECWGLSAPYRQMFGEERNLLNPIKRLKAGHF
jgi:MoaA/NifB/PqqE/SkfB family radical SAM enzyme